MSLKFNVLEDMGGYGLHVDTAQTNIEVGATEAELRRLLIDLYHEFGVEDPPSTEGEVVSVFDVGEDHMVIDEPGRYQLVKLEEVDDAT